MVDACDKYHMNNHISLQRIYSKNYNTPNINNVLDRYSDLMMVKLELIFRLEDASLNGCITLMIG